MLIHLSENKSTLCYTIPYDMKKQLAFKTVWSTAGNRTENYQIYIKNA